MKSIGKRDRKSIWHPYTALKNSENPVAITGGKGLYLTDEQGIQYMDAISSWWVNLHGHSHPYIANKVYNQLKKLEHVIFAGYTHPPAVELAERLLKILPGNQDKIFYSDNGSTTVEVALKMTIQFWKNKGKKKEIILAFRNSYHGDTFGSMSVSERGTFTQAFRPLLFRSVYANVPLPGKEEEALKKFRKLINKYKNRIAAFIYEPLVQGAGGMIIYEPGQLEEMLRICKKNKILCIADEVMTGFGRTGKMFASEYMKTKPDILCLSKGITGGTMALGVTSCTKQVHRAFYSDEIPKTFYHGHSYTANPVACAAALASLDLLQKPGTQKNIGIISGMHRQYLQIIKSFSQIESARSRGTILAMELVTGKQKGSYFHTIKHEAIRFFRKKGILIRPLGNVLYIMPPYCIKVKELRYIYGCILNFLTTLSVKD